MMVFDFGRYAYKYHCIPRFGKVYPIFDEITSPIDYLKEDPMFLG